MYGLIACSLFFFSRLHVSALPLPSVSTSLSISPSLPLSLPLCMCVFEAYGVLDAGLCLILFQWT